MPLSDVQIRNLKPKDKQYKVSDFERLYVLVKPSGSRLWQMKYRYFGKDRLLSLGAYPAVSLAQARKVKNEARALLAKGIDPSEAKQEAKRAKREALGHTFLTKINQLRQPGTIFNSLADIALEGARQVLAAALKAEAARFVAQFADDILPVGRRRFVRQSS